MNCEFENLIVWYNFLWLIYINSISAKRVRDMFFKLSFGITPKINWECFHAGNKPQSETWTDVDPMYYVTTDKCQPAYYASGAK